MSEGTPSDLDGYFTEARSWAKDRQQANRSSRRLAWIVAGAAATIALCEAIALAMLLPLKTVVPYTLLVDRQTGFVQRLNPIEPERVSGERALTQSFLVQYVIAREGFDFDTVQGDYRKVALWSAETARRDYLAAMQASNPQSPLGLPHSAVVQVAVKSVTPTGPNMMMIRFDTLRVAATAAAKTESWVVVARYRYSGEPMRAEDRFLNPLGFQVTRYRKSQEALPTFDAAPASPPPMRAEATIAQPVLRGPERPAAITPPPAIPPQGPRP